MSMITRAKTVIGGAIAGLTLLTLTANPTLASTHNQTAISTTPSSLTNETGLTKEQISQTTTPRNQTTQQTNQTGCACCKSMMNNTPGMMNNMPKMRGGQNNQSGPGMMNHTPGQ